MGDVQAAGSDAASGVYQPPQGFMQDALRRRAVATAQEQAQEAKQTPWWQNAAAATGEWVDQANKASSGLLENDPSNPLNLIPAYRNWQNSIWGENTPQGQREAALPGAQAEEASPIATKSAQYAGGALPWIAAGALTGGAADAAGLGGAGLSSAPWLARGAAALGRGALTGLAASGLEEIGGADKPGIRGTLQNLLMGAGWEGGAKAMGALAKVVPWIPDILSKPVGAAAGAALGTAAGYLAMTPAQRADLKSTLVQQGLVAGVAEGVMTLLEGREAFIPESARNATHNVTQQAAQDQEQKEAPAGDITPAMGADNWKPGDPMVDTSPKNLQV